MLGPIQIDINNKLPSGVVMMISPGVFDVCRVKDGSIKINSTVDGNSIKVECAAIIECKGFHPERVVILNEKGEIK